MHRIRDDSETPPPHNNRESPVLGGKFPAFSTRLIVHSSPTVTFDFTSADYSRGSPCSSKTPHRPGLLCCRRLLPRRLRHPRADLVVVVAASAPRPWIPRSIHRSIRLPRPATRSPAWLFAMRDGFGEGTGRGKRIGHLVGC